MRPIWLAAVCTLAAASAFALPAASLASLHVLECKTRLQTSGSFAAQSYRKTPTLRVRGGNEPVHAQSTPADSVSNAVSNGTRTTSDRALAKALLAEAFGTFCIVGLGCTTVGNVNFAHTSMGLLEIALAFAVAVAGAAHMAGPISGAHFNPAISLARFATGVFAIARRCVPCGHGAGTWLPLYILAQFVGGFAGAILGGVFGCYPNAVFGAPAALLAEVVGTALLAAACSSLASGWQVGAWLATLILVFAPISGACFNPARDLGPRLVAMLMGFDAAKTMAFYFSHYLFAPILGAVLGMSAMDFLQNKK